MVANLDGLGSSGVQIGNFGEASLVKKLNFSEWLRGGWRGSGRWPRRIRADFDGNLATLSRQGYEVT